MVGFRESIVSKITFLVVYLILCKSIQSGGAQNEICWETGCQLDSWEVRGCAQYNRIQIETKKCETGGNLTGTIFKCCPIQNNTITALCNEIFANETSPFDITYNQFKLAATSNGFLPPSCVIYRSYILGLPRGNITLRQEAAMALANFLQESDGLRAKREYVCIDPNNLNCPTSYLTPDCDAPGQYYFGRGYIQLTWCRNYMAASNALFGDERLVQNPDLVAQDEQTAWDTAFWYWAANVHIAPGVQDGKFGASTKAINGVLECGGGANEEQARRRYRYYVNVRQAYGLEGLGDESGCYN